VGALPSLMARVAVGVDGFEGPDGPKTCTCPVG